MEPSRDEELNRPFDTELIQTLVQAGIKYVPERFVQPSEYRPNTETVYQDVHIPVVDFRCLDCEGRDECTLNTLASACAEWGFFQVINHGVGEELLQKVMSLTREFFQLPFEAKHKWASKPGEYLGYGQFKTSNDTVFDWVDSLGYRMEPQSSVDYAVWPTDPPTFREVTKMYGEEVRRVVLRLCSAISESLGLQSDYIETAFGEYTSFVRSNYYPPCPEPDRALGLNSHSDASILTVLIEEGENGLQVERNGSWVRVNGIPNALIVNVGDVLQVLSNGRLKSANHRVVVSRSKERYSHAVFYIPSKSPDILMQPAQELVSQKQPALYKGISYSEYMNYYLTNKTRGKARVESLLLHSSLSSPP